MASSIVITVSSEESQSLNQQLHQQSGQPKLSMLSLSGLFRDLASHRRRATISIQTASAAPVAASGTVTLANVSADDTVTIGKTTLTAKAEPSGEDQFSQAGTDTVDAAALVAKINAHSVLSKLVVASNVAGVVTITCLTKGEIGNHIALASSNGTRLAVSAAYLASGTGGIQESGLVVDRT